MSYSIRHEYLLRSVLYITFIGILQSVLLSFTVFTANAQTVDDFRYASPLFKKVDDQGKLIGGVITSGIEAKNGMFWFGSQNGLMSFDGYQFKRYGHVPGNVNSPAANYIIALAEDSDGYIWLATRTSGLSRYSPSEQKFIHFNTQSAKFSLRTNTLRTLRFDHQGYLWLGHELGADKIDTKQLTITPYTFPIANSISFHLFPDNDGRIIAGTTKGVFVKEATSEVFTAVDLLKNLDVRSIYRTKKGMYWLGTKKGLRLWDGGGKLALIGHNVNDLSNAYIRSIVPLPNGKIWVATYGKGLVLFDEESAQLIKHFKHDPSDDTSLAFDDVGTILLSKSGTLLIGTWGAGLQLLNTLTSDSFVMMRHSLQHTKGLSFANVRTLLELQDGRLLIGTTGNGLDLINPSKGRETNIQHSITGDILSNTISLAQQKDGLVWVGTASSGLLQLNLNTLKLTEGVVNNVSKGAVLRLLMLPDQTLIVGTSKGVCKKLINSKQCIELQKPDGSLMGDTVTALVADKYNNTWISTHNGLYRLKPNTTLLDHYTASESKATLSHNYVLGMVTNQDKIWLSTSTGFDSVTQLNAPNPLFQEHKKGDSIKNKPGSNMLLDNKGRIWSAISLFDPENDSLLKLSRAIGVDIGTAWLGSFTKLRSGLMAFGGIKGVLIVDPNKFNNDIPPSNLFVTSFIINDKDIPLARLEQLSLLPTENDISIQVATADITRAKEIEYQYKLAGKNGQWRSLDNSSRTIHYNNLPPGNHQLSIRAKYNNFSTQISPLQLAFTVQPYYWQTWWFSIIILCLLCVVIALIFRWRIGLVRAQALHLEGLVNQRTHEIEVINQIGKNLTTQLLLDDVLNDIYKQLSKIFIADRFAVGILNNEKNLLEFNYAVEQGIRYQRYVRNMDQSGQLAVHAVKYNQSIIIDDYQEQHQDYYPIEDHVKYALTSGEKEQKVASMMYVPMQQAGSVLGVISVQSISKNSYSQHDLTLMETLASYASIAINNAHSHQNLLDLHQELKLSINELKQTQQQLILNERMAYLGQLVAGVAHEINTPAGVAITAASLLEDMRIEIVRQVNTNNLSKADLERFLTSSQKSIHLIQNNIERVSVLVERFKKLAEQEADSTLKNINVNAFCQNVCSKVSHIMTDKNFQVELIIDESAVVKTYPVILERVLSILLQNAYLHAFDDKRGTITIEGTESEHSYSFNIHDDGCGIEAKLLAKIFDPFYTTNRYNGSTGLGLSIAFNLVNKTLNGELSCR